MQMRMLNKRLEKVAGFPSSKTNEVLIVHIEHTCEKGIKLTEIVLVGDQPQHGHPGPVKRLGSPFRGVSFHSCTQRWRSRIKHGSKSEHLGYFASDVEAAKAYNEAARKIHGANAQLNEGVEQVIAESPAVKSKLVRTERVPYNSSAVYHQEPRASTQTRRAQHNKAEEFMYDMYQTDAFIKEEASFDRPISEPFPCDWSMPHDFQWEEEFLDFWLNDSMPHLQPEPTSACGKRPSLYGLELGFEQAKRIRC